MSIEMFGWLILAVCLLALAGGALIAWRLGRAWPFALGSGPAAFVVSGSTVGTGINPAAAAILVVGLCGGMAALALHLRERRESDTSKRS